MGSKLGRPAVGNRTPDVWWIDPLRIVAGDLKDLVLPAGAAFKALGVLLFSYAKLALSLRVAGIEPNFHPYDWRLGLDELGKELAQSILADRRPVTLIAHSMGGLVARMAMNRLPRHCVRRLIMLGTPNFGSFAAVQAIRGTYPFVRKIAALDPKHSPEFLTRHVFRTVPGIYQLLPAAPGHKGEDLFCTSSWPRGGLRPITRLLMRAQGVRAGLAPAESRMVQIVGVNRETVVGVRRSGAQFEYALGLDGDGTVPLCLALMRKLKTYYVEESHANLANNDRVIRACIDLIGGGRSRALPTRWVHRRAPGAVTNDARLKASGGEKIDWRRLTPKQRESLLAELNDGSPREDGLGHR
jgi:pimeloyl-ACP methyl ester carboxylesterase